jgi:hypothetical protein
MQDPNISVAVVFGHMKFQLGVLILPAKRVIQIHDAKSLAEYRNLIWFVSSDINMQKKQKLTASPLLGIRLTKSTELFPSIPEYLKKFAMLNPR